MATLKDYLHLMVQQNGSDLFLTTRAVPCAKVEGRLVPMGEEKLEPGVVREIAFAMLSEEEQKEFEHTPEKNLAISEPGVGRFRVNIFKQRGEIALVLRHIRSIIPSPESLGIPTILKKLILEKRGLILFVGATGSGKSSSVASLIDFRNSHTTGHIITIEDPIEFIHKHKKSIINQREVGLDTNTYEEALKNTLRQAPDVILIGEVRSRETMEHALAFAETGHLCISTLHARSANEAIDRIINLFPDDRHNLLFLDLAINIKAIISQRLIPGVDGKRIAVFEIMLGTTLVQDLIKRRQIFEIKEVMERSANIGMQTFDMDIYRLYEEGMITAEEAIRNSDSQNNMRLKISLREGVNEESSELSIKQEIEDQSKFFSRRKDTKDKEDKKK